MIFLPVLFCLRALRARKTCFLFQACFSKRSEDDGDEEEDPEDQEDDEDDDDTTKTTTTTTTTFESCTGGEGEEI